MALRLGPALLIVISFLSLMIGIMLHGISINELDYRNPPAAHFKQGVVIDQKLDDNLMWFLQVTDLHLSNRGNYQREKDFVEFCDKYVDIFRPDAVLVTGDITDGRQPNTTFGTSQQLDEWEAYANAISKSKSLKEQNNKTKWFDIRGNHDNFNVYRPEDPSTLYRQYSVMGRQHSRNYISNVTKGDKVYAFIGVDEVQTPGVKIFNFIGLVRDEDLSELKRLKQVARDMNSEFTTWFAHYPTSCIVSPKEGLRNVINGPYLCGHYHTIDNLVTQMHATQQPGFAELELGDWKQNRRIRLASVDHQLFNFVDFGFKEFPVALMTNPKKSEFSMPKLEPLDRISKSTHIRVLAFSNATRIASVTVTIDGNKKLELDHSEGPLWTHPWNPKDFQVGLHTAEISVEDSARQKRSYRQDFSLDNTKQEFSLGARILLRAYFKTNVMALFYFLVIVCTLPLLILRLVSYNHGEVGLKRHYKGTFLYKLHQLSNIKRLFVPLFIIPIWIAVGPHFVGRLVDEAIGVCFVWGILIDGTLVHTGITFMVGSLFLLFIHIPEVILLTYQTSCAQRSLQLTNSPAGLKNLRIFIHVFVVTMMQLFMGSLLYSGQGLLAILTSFPYLWCILIYAYCWYQCKKLDKSDFSCLGRTEDSNEQQPLTSQRVRDDKSSSSDQSGC